MAAQASLNNFFQSVRFSYPRLAEAMEDDISTVAVFSFANDKSGGREAAERLRQQSMDLPEIHKRVLSNALTELGY
jgi:hypothetical protein